MVSVAAYAAPVTHFDEPGFYPGRDYVNQSFAEHIDPFNGNLELHYVDVFLPGNGGFDLKVQRSYNSINAGDAYSPFGRGWNIHFGKVRHDPGLTNCTNAVAQSLTLELPQGTPRVLYKSDAGVAGTVATDYVTTDLWKGQCITGGIRMFAPNGWTYDFTEADADAWHVKTITDRNGNTATFTYQDVSRSVGSPPVAATRRVVLKATFVSNGSSIDNRVVDFDYISPGRLSAIRAHGRTWSYGMSTHTDGSLRLDTVSPPDGPSWGFNYNPNLGTTAGSYAMQRVTYPQGGTITYAYNFVNFMPGVTPSRQWTVVSSKNAGGDVWSFNYQPSPTNYDTTTVTLPASMGTITYLHFSHGMVSAGNMWKIGLLAQKTTSGQGASQVESLGWGTQTISNEDLVRPQYKASDAFIYRPLLTQRQITRDGVNHTTTYSNFDSFGNAQTVSEVGSRARTTQRTFYNNVSFGRWIIGFPKDENIGVDRITSRTYLQDNLQTETVDNVTTTFTYYNDGSVATRKNARGITTTFSNNRRGIAQNESRPEGVSIGRNVDDFGNVTSESDGDFPWGYAYDGLNRIIRVTPPRGNVINIDWFLDRRTLTRGSFSESLYFDGYGRTVRSTRSLITGDYKRYGYDALGRRTFESLPGSTAGTTTNLDSLGRPRSLQLPGNFSKSFSYSGYTMTVTNERFNSTTYTYDRYGDPDQGFVVSIATPGGFANVSMTRDLVGRLYSADQNGVLRTYGYTNGFLSAVTDPESGMTSMPPDAVGNIQSRTVGGVQTTYTYDGLNRMRTASYGGTVGTVTFSYDNRGNVRLVQSAAADREYTYDQNGNLITDTLTVKLDPLGAIGVTYTYDLNDKLLSLIYPTVNGASKGSVNFAPDALGRSRAVSPFVTSVDYWNSGNLQTLVYGNNMSVGYTENSRQLPESITSTGIQLGLTYSYDGVGNVSSISNVLPGEGRTMTYDAVDRLATATGPWGSSSQFVYEDDGNLKKQQLGAYVLDYTYHRGGTNRLLSVSGAKTLSFTYDTRGNVTNNGVYSLLFDEASRLACIRCNLVDEVRYQYDGQGRRITADSGGKRTYFIQAPNGDLQFEYAAFGKRWTRHAYLAGKRVASESGSDANPTSLAVTSSPPIPAYAQPVTLTATVTPSVATGTVEFIDGGTSLGIANVSSGQATLVVSTFAVGTHNVVAEYSGDANYQPATGTRTVTVSKRASSTTPPSLTPASPTLGNNVTLFTTVTGTSPTGQVEFRDNGALIGTQTLSAGVATQLVSSIAAGSHSFTATYLGDANHNGSASGATAVTVAKVTPSVAVGSSQPSSTTGQLVTFTATIGAVTGVAGTGTVTFMDGGTILASSVTVFGNAATYQTSLLGAGSHAITASYSGDSNYQASTSAVFTQTVTATSVDAIIDNFYLSIFGRAADPNGHAFYVSEVQRLFNLGVDKRESLRVIAKSFFFYFPEYASYNKTDSQFIDDLYRTFFQRNADAQGKAYWLDQMAQGLNREAVLLSFMFSPEFQAFMDGVLGTGFVQRPESALTMDTYRAAFSRLPESDSAFTYWRGTIRTAQCNPGGNAVDAATRYLVNYFFGSAEYAGRNRTNRQYVADLYDVLLRRGADLQGFNFWVGQLDGNLMSRQVVMDYFFTSPEWGTRYNEIANAGCVPQ